MNNLLPDQTRVLSNVLQSNDILISSALKIEREDASKWISRCESLVEKHSTVLIGKLFAFGLEVQKQGTALIALSHILGATTGDGAILKLDMSGKWSSTKLGSVTVSGALARTKSSGELEVLVHGTYVYIVLSGELLAEYDVLDATKLPPAGISFYRPTKQLRELIFDHAGQEVIRETGVRYWADKKKRILLASPESTEKIFQRSLLSWLRHYVVDKIRIYSETRGFGQDATDITVMTGHGDYVVEVKWMGENENGTKYDGAQVSVGVEQIKLYLDNDQRLISGAVVIYDGRPSECGEEHLLDSSTMHPRCQMPHLVWLESDTPSQKASVTVRRQTKGATGSPQPRRTAKGR